MRIKNPYAPLDRARQDTRQTIAEAKLGRGPSLGRTVVLMIRLWFGMLWLRLVWRLGL